MPDNILIIKNITREGPGLLQTVLEEQQTDYTIVDLDRKEKLPSPDKFAAIVVLGGPASANDQTPEMLQELDFVKKTIELKKPYLGICLGMQVLAKAAGSRVIKSPVKEVGFFDQMGNPFQVELKPGAVNDPLFNNLADTFRVFHLHGETIEPHPNIKLLGTGSQVENQIIKVHDRAYGIQCHFELTQEMFEQWITEDPDLLELDTYKLRKAFGEIQKEYTETGLQLFKNFLNII